ncbi:DoxX family protein [Saccharopolyspora phatthalungensis]|uniref:Putative membrane protein YphA (DoxX/SURF4 family) n=1 Tax=Saccharopolyspora phatthalungensis TaxID=664693 RepID=A0A840QC14_9PSEU|nr:DoxX family protein [Saccharopolyspora phatthalungensis]MBB5157497.1 putative membrane protein YphA (DoxX/SURF4 family) [Saccharopolyspora phatthalungensis]
MTTRTFPARVRLLGSEAPKAVILIRIVVGGIFLSEGIQKFLFPVTLGPGRFAKETPLPVPEFFAYVDGIFEIGCGLLLILGLFTRLAAIPMIINMIGAEIFTKLPILLGDGIWDYLHEARTELGQLFGAVFLLIVGAGPWSLDARLATRRSPQAHTDTTGE